MVLLKRDSNASAGKDDTYIYIYTYSERERERESRESISTREGMVAAAANPGTYTYHTTWSSSSAVLGILVLGFHLSSRTYQRVMPHTLQALEYYTRCESSQQHNPTPFPHAYAFSLPFSLSSIPSYCHERRYYSLLRHVFRIMPGSQNPPHSPSRHRAQCPSSHIRMLHIFLNH